MPKNKIVVQELTMEQDVKSFIGKNEFKKYKEFAFKDDMLKLAIGFILGNSFNSVVTGISDFLVMPVVRFLTKNTGESWRRWTFVPIDGLEFEFGKFFGVFIDFLLISIILYVIYVRIIGNIIRREKNNNFKQCSNCCSFVDLNAKRCKHCTSYL